MKILQLDLKAFGPFTGKTLHLSDGNNGLHMVYGPNEAGKSAALRALTAFLYGIHPKTPDNFLHDYNSLQIGARLQKSDGTQKYFTRRKGNKNTLLDESGNIVGEDTIRDFLDGVPLDVFMNMYGINADVLVKGGLDLVRGQGAMGTVLFSAASGVPEVREILASIEARAEELFKSRGTTQEINRLIKDFEELKKKRKECSLSVKDWEEIEESLQGMVREKEAIFEKVKEKNITLNRIGRLLEVYKDAGELKEIRTELDVMGKVIILPEDFTARRVRAEEKLSDAREALLKDTHSLEGVSGEILTLNVPSEILKQKNRITNLFQESGNYKQANEQLPRLQGNVLEIERAIRRILRELKLPEDSNNFAQYCLSVPDRTRIEELCTEHTMLTTTMEHLKKDFEKTERVLDEFREKLQNAPNPCDLGDLAIVLNEYRQSGINERQLKELKAKFGSLEASSADGIKRLKLNDTDREHFLSLPIPGKQTVKRFAKDGQAIEQQLSDARRQSEDERASLVSIQDDIKILQVQGAVPTEEDLMQSRGHRDTLWGTIRAAWMGGHTIQEQEWKAYDVEAISPGDAFEHTMHTADEISDRLRRESDRVAQLAQFLTRKERCVEKLKELSFSEEALSKEKLSLGGKWGELWQATGITPDSPEEILEWLDLYDATLKFCQEWKQTSSDLTQITREIEGFRKRLSDLILKTGEDTKEDTLSTMCTKADALIKLQGERTLIRKQLEERLRESEKLSITQKKDIKEGEKHLSAWKVNWTKAVTIINLDADATPEQALAVLRKFDEIAANVRDLEEKSSRIKAIESDGKRFETNVAALCDDLGCIVEGKRYAYLIEQLNQELTEGLKSQERLKALERNKTDLEKSIEKHRSTIKKNEADLQGLLKEAGCDKALELPERESLSRAYLKINERAGELKRTISRSAGGVELDVFLAEIENVDVDMLPQEIAVLENDLKELENQRSDLDQEIGRVGKEQESMAGGSKASEVAEDIELVLAKMRDATQEYVRLTLTASQMRDALESYRKENQGPVLTRAGDFFKRITLGRFEGLTTDYDGDDQPVLVGLRSGKNIPIEAMSDGTCDQLYLALRLASLEQQLRQREPLPLILDDVLVNFDDIRAKQTLQILAELSTKTQVILFTHHRHLFELAQHSLNSDVLYTQEL
jgi:uncharacterized protein YhaN